MKNIDLAKIRKAHFVGIGGIGVSAIARMMLSEGKIVSGSDSSESLITKELEKLGAKIFLGHSADNIKDDIDLLVYTPAVNEENPELKKGKKLGVPCLSYPEMLGLVSKDKYTIAIAGTHGKTTTTAMIGKILIDSKKDPMIIVGSLLKVQGSNFVAGKSEPARMTDGVQSGGYFVVEACEYKRSFLNLNPSILVITNIEADHLDYYKDIFDIERAFAELISKVGKAGYVVCDPFGPHIREAIEDAKCNIVDYTEFIDEKIKLKIPGRHNVLNAAASLAVSHILQIDRKLSEKSLRDFSGTWRRFEYKGKTKGGSLVYDDYGHHPTEIRATLSGARELYPKSKIIVVFQPHLYSRTKNHLTEFGKSFKDSDLVIVSPIYAAREKDDSSINSQMLAEEIKKNNKPALCFENFSEIESCVAENGDKDSVVITMGAGDIYKVGENMIK